MIIFASPNVKLPALRVTVGEGSLQSARQLKSLGVMLDVHLTVDAHIEWVCQASYFQLRTNRIIQNVLSLEVLGILVRAFVTARLNYCYSILIGTQDASIQKIQLLQNSAARLVSKTDRYAHINPVLKYFGYISSSYPELQSHKWVIPSYNTEVCKLQFTAGNTS